jgi:hypothetical protein
MKKRILSAMLLASITITGAIADETKTKDLSGHYKNSKEMMADMKTNFPGVYDVVTDYFQAKTCKEDFIKDVSVKEIKKFTMTSQYGILIGLKYQDTPITKADYLTLISSYKVMNCGDKDAMRSFAVGTGAIAVEMNGNQAK